MKVTFPTEQLSGVVFDIQRFALHDGPGIRTVVFLKGCPLRCRWCSNPESQQPQPQLAFIARKCTHCLECVKVCPHGAHTAVDGKHQWLNERCCACFRCVAVCAFEALRSIGKTMTVEEVMVTVRRDRRYYEKSGGGLTLSGGEPTLQPEFALALLRQAKAEGIHTCMETAGFAPAEVLDSFAEAVDLFLFDLKLFDDLLHEAWVGASNRIILENLARLTNKAAVRLRCPIVPRLNDDDDHFARIAEWCRRLPNLKGVDLLPYHDYGRSKAADVGMAWQMNQPSATDEQAKQWRVKLSLLGISDTKEKAQYE